MRLTGIQRRLVVEVEAEFAIHTIRATEEVASIGTVAAAVEGVRRGTVQIIFALAAKKPIATSTRVKDVLAPVSANNVVAITPLQMIGPVPTEDDVVAATATYNIVASSCTNSVITVSSD